MYFTVDTLQHLHCVITHDGCVISMAIGRDTTLQRQLGSLNKDHYQRLCPVPNDGIAKEIACVRVRQGGYNGNEFELWFPSIPHLTFLRSSFQEYHNRMTDYYSDNKFWRAYVREGHNCPLTIRRPEWVQHNLEHILRGRSDRRVTVDPHVQISTALEAWEMSCDGYNPVIPSALKPSDHHDNNMRLVRSRTMRVWPLPRLKRRGCFRRGEYTDPTIWKDMIYVSLVDFDVTVHDMYSILNICVTQGVLYPKVKELGFGEDALLADRQLFEIARFFPRLLCVHSDSEDPEIHRMGAEVFGDVWHPLD